jgi:mRNA-degrading endonuclease RelE of RelBE toxin-antitoxin system
MGRRVIWSAQARVDLRGIAQPIALQILKTLSRYAQAGEGDTKQLRGIDPPLFRLRAQDHRVLFRTTLDAIVVARVLDRKDAYR